MLKNKNLQTGLLVFVVTLIGLIAFAQFQPKDNLQNIEGKIDQADLKPVQDSDIVLR